MIRSHRAVGPCFPKGGVYGPHWHHTCWNCETDICGGMESISFYRCRCGCQESEKLAYIQTDINFDPEFAASHSSPA